MKPILWTGNLAVVKKKHKMRIAQNVGSVDELLLSQENALSTHRTIHQIQETGIPQTSVHRIKADVM